MRPQEKAAWRGSGNAATLKEANMPGPERDEYGRVCTSDAGPIPEEDRFEEPDGEDGDD